MTVALDRFEREMWKSDSLVYALRYVDDHADEMRAAVAKAKALGTGVRFRDFRDFQKSVLEAVTVGSLALFWRGFEAYCRTLFGTSDCISTVRDRCPGFVAQCHRDHPLAHVLTILRDVRDWELHSSTSYNFISCDRPPDDITLQPAAIRESNKETIVLLFHDMSVKDQMAWLEKVPVSRTRNDLTTLGEFLVEEARECVRTSDALSTPSGGLRRGKKLPPRKPLSFLSP